jgi:hypothetical protein
VRRVGRENPFNLAASCAPTSACTAQCDSPHSRPAQFLRTSTTCVLAADFHHVTRSHVRSDPCTQLRHRVGPQFLRATGSGRVVPRPRTGDRPSSGASAHAARDGLSGLTILMVATSPSGRTKTSNTRSTRRCGSPAAAVASTRLAPLAQPAARQPAVQVVVGDLRSACRPPRNQRR